MARLAAESLSAMRKKTSLASTTSARAGEADHSIALIAAGKRPPGYSDAPRPSLVLSPHPNTAAAAAAPTPTSTRTPSLDGSERRRRKAMPWAELLWDTPASHFFHRESKSPPGSAEAHHLWMRMTGSKSRTSLASMPSMRTRSSPESGPKFPLAEGQHGNYVLIWPVVIIL
jgi:hypothetical protein